jgi:hypothetical protein
MIRTLSCLLSAKRESSSEQAIDCCTTISGVGIQKAQATVSRVHMSTVIFTVLFSDQRGQDGSPKGRGGREMWQHGVGGR